jgi:hypothetical protein
MRPLTMTVSRMVINWLVSIQRKVTALRENWNMIWQITDLVESGSFQYLCDGDLRRHPHQSIIA